ncbi:flavodoxin domain-containing protein [Neobacillus drentensis]|uniref:flavodoxin domain-containing protein n=1 Tax=Neobacillus drentensis TaxID=220684 RepID=UPI00300049E9
MEMGYLDEIEGNSVSDYACIFIGTYTWGDGDYPDECLDIIEELEQLKLENQLFAIFGSGDTSYSEFWWGA